MGDIVVGKREHRAAEEKIYGFLPWNELYWAPPAPGELLKNRLSPPDSSQKNQEE